MSLPFKCPNCYHIEKKHKWQTKALDKVLSIYKPGEYVGDTDEALIKEGKLWILTLCKKCGASIDAGAMIKNYKLTSRVDYTARQKRRRRQIIGLSK